MSCVLAKGCCKSRWSADILVRSNVRRTTARAKTRTTLKRWTLLRTRMSNDTSFSMWQNVESKPRVPVPEGHPTMAQRFNAGSPDAPSAISAEGTAEHGEPRAYFRRPFGTGLSSTRFPNVETLGYCRISLRDRELDKNVRAPARTL